MTRAGGRRGGSTFLAVIWLFILAGARQALAHPETALGFRMICSEDAPFSFWVDGRQSAPLGIPLGSVEGAATAAYGTWQDVACASTAFRYRGLSTDEGIAEPGDTQDAYSVSAVWVTSRGDPAYDLALAGGAATAAAVPTSFSGRLYQCDVFLNGVDRVWSTAAPTPSGAVDLQTHLLHEAGHCQGLGHSPDPADVMYAATPLGAQRRALTAHDAQDLCALYPQAGAVGSPCAASACTAGLTCVPAPDGGTGFCTRGCTPAPDDCPAPFVCAPSAQVQGATHACAQPGATPVTRVGQACADATECGAPAALCLKENDPGPLPSGAKAWTAGYCSQACAGPDDCPAESSCVDLGAAGKRCLKTCRPGTGDCRPGYSCATPVTQAPSVCVPSCAADADCAAGTAGGAVCRACDGVCLAKQNPQGELGAACAGSASCGTGQSCLFFGSATTGVCASLCGHACVTCLAGFSCRTAGVAGELYCLRDCTPGSCPSGLRCAQLSQDSSCVSPCEKEEDCAVGDVCQAGECVNPFEQDAGAPDAGRGSPPPRGCGCGVTASGFGWAALLGMALTRRRGRRRLATGLPFRR